MTGRSYRTGYCNYSKHRQNFHPEGLVCPAAPSLCCKGCGIGCSFKLMIVTHRTHGVQQALQVAGVLHESSTLPPSELGAHCTAQNTQATAAAGSLNCHIRRVHEIKPSHSNESLMAQVIQPFDKASSSWSSINVGSPSVGIGCQPAVARLQRLQQQGKPHNGVHAPCFSSPQQCISCRDAAANPRTNNVGSSSCCTEVHQPTHKTCLMTCCSS